MMEMKTKFVGCFWFFLRGPHTWPKRLAAILMHGHGNAVRATASQNAQNDGQMDGWMD